jgi:ribosomal subunit interface protein
MKFKHHFKSLQSSEAAKQYIEEKFEKLDTINLKKSECSVHYLKAGSGLEIEVHINNPDSHFKASAEGETYFECTDEVFHKLSKQFTKAKDRKITRRKTA